MKQDAGLILVIFSLFALWLYNTGRAEAMIAVIKDPSTPHTSFGGGGGYAHGGSGGGTNLGAITACYEQNAAGGFNPGCIEDIWKGLNSPGDILGTIGGLFGGIFG